MFADFETLMDPSRNHRVYRLTVAKLSAPIIPFMPLLMKGKRVQPIAMVGFIIMHLMWVMTLYKSHKNEI